jgi:hypothetical protein
MVNLYEEFKRIARTLQERNFPYALCGGLAVGIYTEPRATIDIDLVIAPEELDQIVSALQDLGFRKLSEPMLMDGGAMPIQRLIKLLEGETEVLMLDLCMPERHKYPRVWRDWVSMRVEDVEIRLLSLDGLIEMKSSRSSDKDLADIKALKGKNRGRLGAARL